MKLEIGSGLKPHEGYTTIDVEEYAHPDFVGDFRTMSFEGLEEIRSHHLFEHFSRDESGEILSLWYKWLKPQGILIIETPDFEGICEQFTKRISRKERYWLCRHAYGSQEQPWAYHKDGWWVEKFRQILPLYGFKITGISKSVSRSYLPNITIVAKKI
jgi:hypothetical protein